MKNLQQRLSQLLGYVFLCCLLTACADFGLVDHSVQMDLRRDNQRTAVIALKYGTSKSVTGPTEYQLQRGLKSYYEGVTGPMPRPKFIYAKWEDLDTGKIYEDTVDMTQRLPRELEGKTVILGMKGSQLYIYVRSKERRPANVPPFGPSMYQDYQVVMIYPDQQQAQQK